MTTGKNLHVVFDAMHKGRAEVKRRAAVGIPAFEAVSSPRYVGKWLHSDLNFSVFFDSLGTRHKSYHVNDEQRWSRVVTCCVRTYKLPHSLSFFRVRVASSLDKSQHAILRTHIHTTTGTHVILPRSATCMGHRSPRRTVIGSKTKTKRHRDGRTTR
jgi:hypothetical protein